MSGRKRFSEGTLFLVPLRDSGYAVGVLARISGQGHAFGYFFGPRIGGASELDTSHLDASDAILMGKFGDLNLIRGSWPEAGSIEHWDRAKWPMTPLARIDESVGRAWLSTYDEEFKCVSEEEISVEDAYRFPPDRLMGAGSVEIRLTKLLGDSEAQN